MKNTLLKLRMIWPLTLRGMIISGVAYFCLVVLGLGQSDLIASIVGSILLICILTFLLVLVPSYLLIKKSIRIETLSREEKSYSMSECDLGLSLSNFKVPPLFLLNIQRVFDFSHDLSEYEHATSRTIVSKIFQCRGSFIRPVQLTSPLRFPHRGIYKQSHYLIHLSDYFGITKISWIFSAPLSFSIYAPEKQIEPIPVMLASSVSGDLTSATDIRSGDLFDTKQYQPGDSIKRVLWKVYARSEELIVRHPEPAIIPEGELVSYSVALPEQDDVISATINYLKMVDSQNISFLSGFSGAKGVVATSIVKSEDNSLHYLLELSESNAISEFEAFINTLRTNNHHPAEIILFAPRLSSPLRTRETSLISAINAIISQAENLQLKVHLAEVECSELVNSPTRTIGKEFIEKVVPLKRSANSKASSSSYNTQVDTYRVKFI